MKHLFMFCAFLFASVVLNAQTVNKIDFVEYDLDNGLHVILHQDNSTPVVTVSVMYHVGSKNENPNRTGFAHFFEHLMFEGTKNIERGEYSEIVERAGGTLNANTSADRTYYYELLPAHQLELGLWLESERMLHARVDSIGIATQKKVVCEEIKERQDNQPYGDIQLQVQKRAFKKHPYRWTTLGSADHVRNAKDEDFKAFYEDFYVPNNAVLVVAGDIDVEKTKEWVEKYYADIPRSKKEIYRPNVVEPEKHAEIRDTVYDNIQLPMVLQAYHTPAMGTDDYYAVDMLSSVLSGGQSSRMYKELVDKKQLALQVALFPMPYEDPSVALTFALPNMGKDLTELENAMDAEIERMQNELITDREFQKLRNQYESQFVNQNASMEGLANVLARYHTFFGDAGLVNTELDKYMSVTKEDIQRVAKKYFRKDNRVVLYYLPEPKEN